MKANCELCGHEVEIPKRPHRWELVLCSPRCEDIMYHFESTHMDENLDTKEFAKWLKKKLKEQ